MLTNYANYLLAAALTVGGAAIAPDVLELVSKGQALTAEVDRINRGQMADAANALFYASEGRAATGLPELVAAGYLKASIAE